MFEKIKNTIKAEAQKDAQKINNALNNVKKGVSGAKEQAKNALESGAKNLACAPLLPVIPAMLYLLKKEKNITFSAKTVLEERYKIVESFYNNIVVPYNASHFDMVEMSLSDLEHVDEETDNTTVTEGDEVTGKSSDIGSQITDLMSKTAQGGLKGAKLGAKLSPIMTTLGVPPPADKLAGASVGGQLGAIITACVEFFRKGITKVNDALKATQKESQNLMAGLPIAPQNIGLENVNYKKYLLPVAIIVLAYIIFKPKN